MLFNCKRREKNWRKNTWFISKKLEFNNFKEELKEAKNTITTLNQLIEEMKGEQIKTSNKIKQIDLLNKQVYELKAEIKVLTKEKEEERKKKESYEAKAKEIFLGFKKKLEENAELIAQVEK